MILLDMPPDTSPYNRPRAHLQLVRQRYPDAWMDAERCRRARGKDLDDWPQWCYLPLDVAYLIVSNGENDFQPPEREFDVAPVAALAAWRETQGIYEFDPTVLDALSTTPLGDLPIEILRRLPEWCVYLLTPGRSALGMNLHGVYAQLVEFGTTCDESLSLVLDTTNPAGVTHLMTIGIPLGHGTIEEALAERLDVAQDLDHGEAEGIKQEVLTPFAAETLTPIVSMLLYLCSQDAEILDRPRALAHPRRPPRRYPQSATTWDVAYRLGAAIRAGQRDERSDSPASGGTHSSPRPHIRRAHWHSYWVGPQADPARHIELRWLPPIPIGIADDREIVPTVHPVL